jgi:hypothetical protein
VQEQHAAHTLAVGVIEHHTYGDFVHTS